MSSVSGEESAVILVTTSAYPRDEDWLDQLVGILEMEDVAAVAPRILSADGQKVVDMGVVYDPQGAKVMLHKNQGYKDLTIAGGTLWVRDVDELTGAIVAYRAVDHGKRRTNQQYVIWSHVDFLQYGNLGVPTHFNNNLRVLPDGRVTVNE